MVVKYYRLSVGFRLGSEHYRLSIGFWTGYEKELDLLTSTLSSRLLWLEANGTGLKLIV